MLMADSGRFAPWRSHSPVMRRVLVVNGHPDPRPERFCAALCNAYADGARSAGHRVRSMRVGELPLSTDSVEFAIAREQIGWSDRLLVAFPIWLGGPPPAVVRVFDAFAKEDRAVFGEHVDPPGMERRSHLVMTASLPSLLYRSSGIPHVGSMPGMRSSPPTIIGSVNSISEEDRRRWLREMENLGAKVK